MPIMNSVFSFISGFMACFRERVRDRLIVISIFCLILLVFIHGSELVSARFLYYVIMGCGLLGVIILCSVRGEQRQQPRISKGFFAVWMLYGLLQIVSGIVNGYEYLPDGVLILIAFPVLYLAWNDRGFEAVFPLVLKGLRYSMYLMLAVSFLFFPLKGVQYTGLFSNQNALADYLTVVFCGLFIELLGKKSLKSSMGLLVLAGVAFALIYYSGSRTGMLATLLGTVFVAGMEIARERRHCGLLLKKCVGLLLSAFVFSNVLIYVFMLRAILPLPDFADIIRWLGIDTTRIPRIAAYSRITELDMFDFSSLIGDISEVSRKKLAMVGRTLDQYTSGRITIWSVYVQDLNFKGHRTGYSLYVPGRSFADPVTGKFYSTAHNFFLQNAYNHGVICGAVSLVLVVWSTVRAFLFARKHCAEEYSYLPMIFILAFDIASLFSSANIVFWYINLLFYCFVMEPLFLDLRGGGSAGGGCAVS